MACGQRCTWALLLWLATSGVTGYAATTNILFDFSKSWKFWESSSLDGETWKVPAYDDSNWPSGAGLLAYEPCNCLPQPVNTPLTTSPSRSTFYFRTQFNYSGGSPDGMLVFSNLIDDGAVFYLNGVEVHRIGMPGGTVTYTNNSQRLVDNAILYDVFTVSGILLSNLVVGDNVLAVEVHQAAPSSSDAVFGCALSYVSGIQPAVIRGPYLQRGSASEIVVRWRTDSGTDSWVRYRTNLANLNLTAANATPTTEHEVLLTGLLPDTKYFYSIGNANGAVVGGDAQHYFITAPPTGSERPVRIWVVGDSGTADGNQVNVRDAYQNFTGSRHTDLWLMLGDNAYETGLDQEYQAAVFNVYTNQLRHSVLWPALGNHDTAQIVTYSDAFAYFNIFTLPKNGEAGGISSGSEHYYSFNYGNIHFICLDSMTASLRQTGSAMYIWLTNDLANITADWTIAYWHHPPYSRGSHDSDTEVELYQMRQNYLPILEAAGVDLVLSGHSHVYERSYLLDGHEGNSSSLTAAHKLNAGSGRVGAGGAYEKSAGPQQAHQGAVYAVVGCSGQITGGPLDHPAMFVSLNNLGSMVLDIQGNRLDAKFLRENGTTNDFFTILKTNAAPVASNLVFAVDRDATGNFNLAGSDRNNDPIVYATNSLPGRGLLFGFEPLTGAFSYTPAHGFSGNDSFTFRVSDGQLTSAPATVTLAVSTPTDSNGNGLPDDWEARYGVTNPELDRDGDGLSDAQEYWAGTNPTNSASALRILGAAVATNGHCTFTWGAVGGTRYRVSYRYADVNGAFTDVVRPVTEEMHPAPPGASGIGTFTDDFSLTGGPPPGVARFYRVQVVR